MDTADGAEWSDLIAARREQLGLSQRQLAQAADVAEKTVYNVEAGVEPRKTTLRKILEALGLSGDIEIAREQVAAPDRRRMDVYFDTNVLMGVADDAELMNFMEQLAQMLQLMPRYKRREVMDEVLNDVLRILRRFQQPDRGPLSGHEKDRLRELVLEIAQLPDGSPLEDGLRAELRSITNPSQDDFELVAHDEEHDIEAEQGHAEHA
jgi:transcriptional regulator with XRE-family HTH domain